jgi:hypothetical protein
MQQWRWLGLFVFLWISQFAFSEPWMTSRFAATGAVSCNSCHTNPSGGGLRNAGGKGSEERWLRSLYFDGYRLNKLRTQATEAVGAEPAPTGSEPAFNGGIDFRWFYLDTTKDKIRKKGAMPMSTDVAASVAPVNHLNLVWESRFLSDPRATDVWDEAYTSRSSVRSAYALVDDLPYHGYAMYGIYRPLFGNFDPDHTSLFARATGLDHNATFKT